MCIQCPYDKRLSCFEVTPFTVEHRQEIEQGIRNGNIVVLTRPPTYKECCGSCKRMPTQREREES